MNDMDEDPYKSPVFEPETQTLPRRPQSKPPNRHVLAVAYGWMAWGGLILAQAVVVETFWPSTVPTLTEKRLMLPLYALLASPVAVLMAWRAWRAPRSKWVLGVACFLGLIWFALVLIGMAFFGLR